MDTTKDQTKFNFELEVRNVLLQRARRLVKLLKSNAPSSIIMSEIKLLQLDLPVFDRDYKNYVMKGIDDEIGKAKGRYGLCSQEGCYNHVQVNSDNKVCSDCNHDFSDFDAIFEKFVNQLKKVKQDCYESVPEMHETV